MKPFAPTSRVFVVGMILSIISGETFHPSLFNWEQTQLNKNDIPDYTEGNNRTLSCKAFPGTPQWPSDQIWSTLNQTVDGTLLKPFPLASVWYNNTVYNNYDAPQCQAVSAGWATIQER